MAALVETWFGRHFSKLHPLLQQLHRSGGHLSGKVNVKVAKGLGGLLGRRLANKFAIPIGETAQEFSVTIFESPQGLHWDRRFNQQTLLQSVFIPVGNVETGYWFETTGSVCLRLTVDVKEAGWYWRCLEATYKGVSIPLWLLPRVIAYKRIENNQYKFYVGFALPLLGEVLSYSGTLGLNCTMKELYRD
jgi:hypothetical protein